ncbi:MAG TPA: hypothetical protein VKR38_14720 [Usitatibacter sp.]|nr:hypothetical protein [Usitatibacter sp.]
MQAVRCLALLAFAVLAPLAARADQASIDAHNRNCELAAEASKLDRIVVATAQSKLFPDPKFQDRIDYFMYRIRPPAVWDPANPAWAPARTTLIAIARPETLRQLQDYWKQLHPLLIREMESSFQPGEAVAFNEFASSTGGNAYFERRLAELRAKNGEMFYDLEPEAAATLAKRAQEAKKKYDGLPAAEKKRVETFLAGEQCAKCYRPPAVAMEHFITGQSDWLAGVFGSQFESTDSKVVDAWVDVINGKLKATIPGDTKKQILGVLEMRKDSSLAFTLKFYWNNKADGGSLTLQFPKDHPSYKEVAALAPNIAPGARRVLYRDENGIIDDQP